MKTIRNLTHKPLKIALAGGKTLHLGPAKTGQIADSNIERPALKRLLDAKEIEIVDEGRSSKGSGGAEGEGHETTHGRTPAKVRHPTGDR